MIKTAIDSADRSRATGHVDYPKQRGEPLGSLRRHSDGRLAVVTTVVRFSTMSGSVYEVDGRFQAIRRIHGLHEPTPLQGPDGRWRGYAHLTPITPGQPVLITWSPDDTSDSSSVPGATLTSAVVECGAVSEDWQGAIDPRENANDVELS